MLISRALVALSAALPLAGLSLAALSLAALPLLVACNQAPDRPDKDLPPRPGLQASGSALGSAGPAPASTPSAKVEAGPPTLVGSWEGRYDAKKGTIEMPPKVKDKARAADDGKAMAGPGKVELTVTANGEVRGKASGALGEATLSGKVEIEAGVLRASWFPVDPTAATAMTGVLIGQLKGATIQATIRVAGPDATLVRESSLDLQRK